jgi:hypothetical protein
MDLLTTKTPAQLQAEWESQKLFKYNVLNRFHRDLQRDPTRYTRFNAWPQKELRVPIDEHRNLPLGELAIATVGSIVFAGVFGFAGWVLSTGSAPNHHVLDHLQPTLRHQFIFQGRLLKQKCSNGKVWAKIGILFALADWWYLSMYNPQRQHDQAIISSFVAGGVMAMKNGPKATLLSGLGFVAFTGLFAYVTENFDFMPSGDDELLRIDLSAPPGAPPGWKPYVPRVPLMPRDERVIARDEMRAEAQRLVMQQQQMQMQMMGGGGPGGPVGPGGPGAMV